MFKQAQVDVSHFMLGLFLITMLAIPAKAESGRLHIVIRGIGEEGAVWARLEVRDAMGKMYRPPESTEVIWDRTGHNFPGTLPYYNGQFVARGDVTLQVPVGKYRVLAERGLEFTRVEKEIVVSAGKEAHVEVSPRRWIDMNKRGWYSADFHVHRPIEQMPPLMLAEGLNLAAVFTMWNKRNIWEDPNPPAGPMLRVDASHIVTLMNAEDERGGGAWMLLNLKRPLNLGVEGRWYPPGKIFVEQAREQGAWFDMEKLIWWEVPVLMAIAPPDSVGVVNNHIQQYGIYAAEAWGRPRDLHKFPGPAGFVAYCLDLYYKYLNLGIKLPASAGSASGVVGNPLGQNRAYAYLGNSGGFDSENFFAAMRRGQTFATNGPMLFLRVNGHLPGETVELRSGEAVTVLVDALAREPIARIEIVANGEVVDIWTHGANPTQEVNLKRELNLTGHTWVAARCFLEPSDTIRLAQTSPVYISSPGVTWDARPDSQFFLRWMDDLINTSNAEKGRFQNDSERNEILALYESAREFYARLAR